MSSSENNLPKFELVDSGTSLEDSRFCFTSRNLNLVLVFESKTFVAKDLIGKIFHRQKSGDLLDSKYRIKLAKTLQKIPNFWEVEFDLILLELAQQIETLRQKYEKEKENLSQTEDKLEDFEEVTDPQIVEESNRILNSMSPIEDVKRHLDNIIIGEDANKQVEFVLLLSGKDPSPDRKQIILFKSEAGSGKSTQMQIADLYKVKDVGRFSKHALDYSDLAAYEVLRLKELGAMDDEEQGVGTLKFLSSEDQGYKVEITVRDENGRFYTEERFIPPMTVVTSTTRVNLEGQFERRSWIFAADESEEQTNRIKRFKAKNQKEKQLKELGLIKYTSKEFSINVLRQVVRQLKPVSVLTPFTESLLDLLKSKFLRVRGDYDKLYALIYYFMILSQNVLPKFEYNSKEFVIATPEKAVEIVKIAEAALVTMTSGLEKRYKPLVERLKLMDLTRAGQEISLEDRENIGRIMGKGERTIRNFLNQLSHKGYFSRVEEGKAHKIKHKLLFEISEIEKSSSSLEGVNFPAITMYKMAQEAKETLSSLEKIIPEDTVKKLKENYDILISEGEKFSSENKDKIAAIALQDPSGTGKSLENESFPTNIRTVLLGQIKQHHKYSIAIDMTCRLTEAPLEDVENEWAQIEKDGLIFEPFPMFWDVKYI